MEAYERNPKPFTYQFKGEAAYLEILDKLVAKYDQGIFKKDRTGTGTTSIFGTQSYYDLTKGKVPLLTTKKIFTKGVIQELLWFISGSTNNNDLFNQGTSIWNEWALPNGDLGPIYGKQWRFWPTNDILSIDDGDGLFPPVATYKKIDQLQKAIDTIRTNPTSRRMLITAWNPSVVPDEKLSPQQNVELGKQCLPACHAFFQFNCEEIPIRQRIELMKLITKNPWETYPEDSRLPRILNELQIPEYYLDCQVYLRSNDWFLGAPFNISQYAILTHIVGKLTNTYPRELVYSTGDTHLYLNHIDQAREQLSRQIGAVSTIKLDDRSWKGDINFVRYEDIEIVGYNPATAIKAPVAI